MTQIIRTTFAVLLLVSSGYFLQNCSKPADAAPSESLRVTALMKASTWKVQSVTVDGTDQSTLFKNFTLGFSDTAFNTSNGGAVWPASGTWKFTDAQATSFTRDDGLVVSIQDISSSSMILSLTWTKTTFGPGRINSVPGETVFTFGH